MYPKLVRTGAYRNTLLSGVPLKHLAPRRSLCGATKGAGETVVSERRGPVLTVAINRPEARNAVNRETARRLLEELEAFEREPASKVAVLHGVGGNFCAGYDLKELANGAAALKLEQDVTKGSGPMGPSRLQFSKPLIAAIGGFAVAGGLELALLADLRVVEESAVMGVFCRRFGVPLIDGGTVRLPRLIGLSRALDLILTGRPIGAQEALAYGLANRVVPDGQGFQAAVQLAEQIGSFPQECLRADRSSAIYGCFDAPSFAQAMQYEIDRGAPVILSEAVAGATRFTSGTGRGDKIDSKQQWQETQRSRTPLAAYQWDHQHLMWHRQDITQVWGKGMNRVRGGGWKGLHEGFGTAYFFSPSSFG
ncbi:uncharacterized protein LOC109527949 isoform X2 [Hippocampus comes]|uniref:uncharacterized protein LOC109527949 isoform X2 n=1 Tax=Hippocampus comes TaxID=109280 RepID=UPI00094E0842|nr:PREDICTED: uncharacterized protein LOC109527949 isoform X2 [Hippocampus comes]